MVKVARVLPDSIADELGIEVGTELVSVNGRDLHDFLDWEFLTADDELVVEARQPDGDEVVYEIQRPEGEQLGVTPSLQRFDDAPIDASSASSKAFLPDFAETSTSATTTTGCRSRTAISPRCPM